MTIFASGFNEYIPQRGLRGGFGKKAEEKSGGQIWFAGSDRPDVLKPAGREKLGHGTHNLTSQGELYKGKINSERPEFRGHRGETVLGELNTGAIPAKNARIIGHVPQPKKVKEKTGNKARKSKLALTAKRFRRGEITLEEYMEFWKKAQT